MKAMAERKEPVTIMPGPNLRAKGYNSVEDFVGPELGAMASDRFVFGRYTDAGPVFTPTSDRKVGRNDPCPCGSGKKFKHCCGK